LSLPQSGYEPLNDAATLTPPHPRSKTKDR
jgi:hypothetical protein